MSQLSPALDAALSGISPTIFGAVEIVLPSHTIRLLDSSGVVTFGGKTFTGADATYGTIDSIETLTDGTGDEAPSVILTINPASDSAAADISSASMQGSQVSMWLGAVDPTTGAVIGDPELFFLGALDVPTIKAGSNGRQVDLEISSAFEWFFFNNDGALLNDPFHQYLWPGETGLSQVTGILHQVYWGTSPASGVSR